MVMLGIDVAILIYILLVQGMSPRVILMLHTMLLTKSQQPTVQGVQLHPAFLPIMLAEVEEKVLK